VARYGRALQFASAELKNDKEVVLAAVAENGGALVHASAELKNDKEVVLAAVAQYGWALGHASVELNNDKEVVLVAVAQDRSALELSLIAPGEFQSFVRGGLVAHQTCVAFLLAARPRETSLLRAATAPHPASWVLDGVGEDAGRHVRQLIAAFAGAPCGQGWVVTRAAEQNS
jgi:hypothetical protein